MDFAGQRLADSLAALFRGEDSIEADAGAYVMGAALKKWLRYGAKGG